MRPIFLGILASLFFSLTFILNHTMALSGGSWLWSASLRYLFMLPILLVLVIFRGNFDILVAEMKGKFIQWMLWSTIGFGLFYAPLCFAAAYGPGWLVAGTWQITILSGTLLVLMFPDLSKQDLNPNSRTRSIPIREFCFSLIILLGIILMQAEHAKSVHLSSFLLGLLPVLLASFAYPLGNRKMMVICQGNLDAFQRVLGMTIASLPVWMILSIFALFKDGPPSASQTLQAFVVAVSSGVVATVLFFWATDLASRNTEVLASVEATQSLEVVFTALGECLLMIASVPSKESWVGMALVIAGMILHSYSSHKKIGSPMKKTMYFENK